MLEALLAPLRVDEMQAGALAGFVALGVVLVLTTSMGRSTRFAGVALGFAVAVAAWQVTVAGPPSAWVGLLLLAVSGVMRHRGQRAALSLLPAAVGVLLVTARIGDLTNGWRWTVAVLGIFVVASVVRFDERSPHAALAPALFLVTSAGIYATVPDAEQALVVLGAALPLAVLSWPFRWGRLGPMGAPVVGGLLVWVVATGGAGRNGSVIGGLACAGLLVCDPVARSMAARSALDRVATNWRGGLVLLGGQLVIVLVASGIAGSQQTAVGALAVAVPVLVLVTGLLVARGSRARAPGH